MTVLPPPTISAGVALAQLSTSSAETLKINPFRSARKSLMIARDCRGVMARVLLQLEFDEFDEGRAGVLHRPRLSGILPDEIAFVGSHAAVGRSGDHFGEHAAVDVDAESRCGLLDLSGRLSGFQSDAPSPEPRVVHDLGVAGDARAVGHRGSGRPV